MADVATDVSADEVIATKRGTLVDVVVAWLSWAVIVAIMVFVALNFDARTPGERVLVVLAGLGGGTLGWASGIILTPYDRAEGRTFTGVGKAVYGLITGYVVGKVDPVITVLVQSIVKGGVPTLAAVATAVALISFVAAATVTFVSRKYWV